MRKFRDSSDVNQYIFAQYQIMTGQFKPINPNRRRYYVIGKDRETYGKTIMQQKADIVCLNDVLDIDFQQEKDYLVSCFNKILPKKSSFEI